MLTQIRNKLQDRKGFTLIELMIVIAILGVLAAVAIPFYNQYIENSKMRITRSNYETAVRTVKTEFANVTAQNPGATDLVVLLNDNDPNPPAGTPACRNRNPFTPGNCAFVAGGSAARGEVGIDVVDFSLLATGDTRIIDAWITSTGPDVATTLIFQ